MKKQIVILLAVLSVAAPVSAQRRTTAPQTSEKLAGTADSVSYALGYVTGARFADDHPELKEELDPATFLRAFQEALGGGNGWLDEEKLEEYVEKQAEARRKVLYQGVIEAGERLLAENRLDPEVHQTASGLQYRVVEPGRDPNERPREYDDMHITYTGKLPDGQVFTRGEDEYSYPGSEDAEGMNEGTQLMSPGARYIFYIPAGLAFGEEGREFDQGRVPPYSVVIYEVYMNSMTRDHGYYDEDEDAEVDMSVWSEDGAPADDSAPLVREAGDYTATTLAEQDAEVSVNGYSADEIVKTYRIEGFTIVMTGDRTIVLDSEGREIFRNTLDEESNDYDSYHLTEFRAVDGAGPLFLVLDMGMGGGSYYGSMLYTIEEGRFRQADPYLALVNEEGGSERLTPVLDLRRGADGIEFRFDSDELRFDPIGDSMSLSGEDFWYLYRDGALAPAGPATALSRFRNRSLQQDQIQVMGVDE